MYQSKLENQLIFPDIVDVLADYIPIQLDIDERRVKAASIIAQNVDVKRIIGKVNLQRAIEKEGVEMSDEDKKLKELLEAPIAYYTYSRLLLTFHGNYTDSGFEVDELATTRNEAKSVSKEMKGIGEHYMQEVIEYLRVEDPDTEADEKKLTPRVRVFGGRECRGSN